MKTDLYTKVVLTVIAVVLTINLLRDVNIITPAQAINPPSVHDVNAPNLREVIDVNIVQIDGRNVSSSSGMLDINLQKLNGDIIGYNGLPVQVKNK